MPTYLFLTHALSFTEQSCHPTTEIVHTEDRFKSTRPLAHETYWTGLLDHTNSISLWDNKTNQLYRIVLTVGPITNALLHFYAHDEHTLTAAEVAAAKQKNYMA